MEEKELLKEYYKMYPNDGLFPEWFDMTAEEKIEMLKEAIKDKKELSQTKIFSRYYERVDAK